MSRHFIARLLILLCLRSFASNGRAGNGHTGNNDNHAARPVTVGDTIRMTEISETMFTSAIAHFSPDGERFAIVINKGQIEQNTNEYSLLLFHSENVIQSPHVVPEVLASMSSSSDRPGIWQVKWTDDNTIVFLGENPGEQQQLYTVDCNTKKLRRLTKHATNLTSYAITANSDRFFFIAEARTKSFMSEKTTRQGMLVGNEVLSDLISLERHDRAAHEELYAERTDSRQEVFMMRKGITDWTSLDVSPDARYLVVRTMLTGSPPSNWKDYEDHFVQTDLHRTDPDPDFMALYRYELIDTDSGLNEVLVDAPTGFAPSEVAWSPDSRSVVISGTFLPLDFANPAQRKVRQRARFVAEVKIPTKELIPVTDQNLWLRRWDTRSGKLLFETTTDTVHGSGPGPDIVHGGGSGEKIVAFQKAGIGWTQVDARESDLNESGRLLVTVEDDLNTPPRLFVRDIKTKHKSLLMDPNPQFQNLQFGKVESITFRARNGQWTKGVIYFPIDYIQGKTYPLVVQTHAEYLNRFTISGPYATAFAAQPLAGKGFVVAQLAEDVNRIETPNEVPDEASIYEGLIEYLDRRQLINREHVGIIAFSRTGLPVEFALTHSKYCFAAASLADISDAGYFRYVALLNVAGFSTDSEISNGGMPFGKGLTSWLRNSPGFNLDKVRTPVWMEANSQMSLLFEWEWFAGLSRLGKPVELLYLPDGGHILTKPSYKLASQQTNVDWFCFWLKGEEDPDPAKAEQYKRWREMRKLQHAANTEQVSN